MAGIIEVKDQGVLRIYDADNSNYVDIVVPSTVSSNRTITIPDATFTIPTADTVFSASTITGQSAETSVANDDLVVISDTSASGALKKMTKANFVGSTGKLLQVVHAHTATIANSSSTSYADTGLTASITPSATSSKVIVIINQSVAKMGGANSYGNFRVYRDSTEIGGAIPARALGSTNDTGEIYLGMPFNYNFQDSPSSTSSVTYKTQFNNGAGTGTIRCQPDSSQSYILLMEVAG